ncbi:MAG: hypothetical protein LCH60_11950 [Actinobacteria bacterium]|nr:hypothetical protein [Actinomycetota bacterium]
MPAGEGVQFPQVDGRRSTSAFGRAVVAEALRPVDPIGARSAEQETNWRQGYLAHFRRLVEAGLGSREDALAIAAAGASSLQSQLVWSGPDGDEPLGPSIELALRSVEADRLRTERVEGTGDPDTALTVPYQGTRLAGDDLRRRTDRWVESGVVEPSLRDALEHLHATRGSLDPSGRTFVVLGAGAEMGPLRALLRWGATVAAVDLPRPELWSRLLESTRHLAGTLLVPARPGDEPLHERAGVDLVGDLPRAIEWVASLEGPLVLGNYVYADGGTNVRVSAAVDQLTTALRADRSVDEVALAFLATPTDVFAVPGEAVAASVEQYAQRRTSKLIRIPLRTLSGGRLLTRNYRPGADPGINDSVVLQQGPNYLLAKRLQRWRAATARAEGTTVSFKVAPPTRTRSVVKNRALAAAYAGAHRFGIEVFEPGTSNTLMAALLMHDLATGSPALPHPWQDEAYAAAHGGLWRAAYEPRSALGLAAILGLGSAR